MSKSVGSWIQSLTAVAVSSSHAFCLSQDASFGMGWSRESISEIALSEE